MSGGYIIYDKDGTTYNSVDDFLAARPAGQPVKINDKHQRFRDRLDEMRRFWVRYYDWHVKTHP